MVELAEGKQQHTLLDRIERVRRGHRRSTIAAPSPYPGSATRASTQRPSSAQPVSLPAVPAVARSATQPLEVQLPPSCGRSMSCRSMSCRDEWASGSGVSPTGACRTAGATRPNPPGWQPTLEEVPA